MRYSRWILAGVFGLVLQGTASAQIYESEDAEGVPEFSDTPTAGAEVVDLPATNVVEPPPAEPATAPQPQSAPQQAAFPNAGGEQEEGADGVIYYGGGEDENVRAQRREDAARINNALPGEPGVGAGAPGVGVEPGRGVGQPGPGVESGPGIGEPGVGVGEPGGDMAGPHEMHREGGARR